MNLKDVKTKGEFEPIPEGRYDLNVEKAELGQAETGNPMIKVTYKITDGTYKGRLVWDNFVLIPNSYWKLKTFLEASGSALADSENVTEQKIADAMVGMKVNGFLSPRTSTSGKPTNDVKSYISIKAASALLN